MKTFKFYSLLLSFVLCFNSSYACDLLDIEIGENNHLLKIYLVKYLKVDIWRVIIKELILSQKSHIRLMVFVKIGMFLVMY